jgi:hypothetical protein
MKTVFLYCVVIFVAMLNLRGDSAPVGTEFIYQGRLSVDASPATGTYDVVFTLYDAANDGNRVGSSVTNIAVPVSDGIFMTSLDFAISPFSGSARWLDLAVRTNGVGDFTSLSPRQRIGAVPYAISANNLSGTVSASQLAGTLPATSLVGPYSAAVTLTNENNVFSGSGSNLTGVNAATLGGVPASGFWRLGGNSGNPVDAFIGTADRQGLQLRANNITGLRLDLTYDGKNVNVVEGNGGSAAQNVIGGTVGGGNGNVVGSSGGVIDHASTISGGHSNYVTGSFSTIGGGNRNEIWIHSSGCTISGGQRNSIESSAPQDCFIAGGKQNQIFSSAGLLDACVIGGGRSNRLSSTTGNTGSTVAGGIENAIVGNAWHSVVSGGLMNSLTSGGGLVSSASIIAGGAYNRMQGYGNWSTISGGRGNSMVGNNDGASISGGQSNSISFYSENSLISGGNDNMIEGLCYSCTVGGGDGNSIVSYNNAHRAANIGGGSGNRVESAGDFYSYSFEVIAGGRDNLIQKGLSSVIGGGESNVVTESYSSIPGGLQAKASNYGQMAHASGNFAKPGDAQTSVYICRGSTADATPTELFLDGVSQRMAMPTNSTWTFDILVTARDTNGTSAGYQLLGTARNVNGITTMAAAPKQNILVEDIAFWDAMMIAHATNNTFGVRVTGAAATSIRWVATVRTSEVMY